MRAQLPAFLAIALLSPVVARADNYCVPGTPVCAKTDSGGVTVGAPKVEVGGSTSGQFKGGASGTAQGTVTPPTVQGSVGGQTAVVAPALDLSWLFTLGAAAQAQVQTQGSGRASAQTQPSTPSVEFGSGFLPAADPEYRPSVGFGFCGGANVSTSYVGAIACLGVSAFVTPWMSIDNDVFYLYGKSSSDAPEHVNLTRHLAAYQPTVAFHAQADGFRFSGRIGGTLEVGAVSREAEVCEPISPNVGTQPLCTQVAPIDEARAYAGAVTGFGLGYAEQFLLMTDFRLFVKGRIDAGDHDEPLGRAEVGGMFMVRFGIEAGSWRH